ncbi:acyl-CoA dehydrogenase family protein [Nocardioides sp. LHD-245]|uniref:acyl-CoA dehydrogenase family protein n=1 Tax=Nocardioides sp. LHD-245 TaxID=3051387 RepID=UPI0027E15574|nr:acyl-CoA dehydrogenase family protein [Nocardioides sp. LHD-245]
MIDLEPDEEQVEIAALARSIADELVAPSARDAEYAAAVPDDVWLKVFETGLVMPVAEEHGGGGVPGPLALLAIAENLGHGDPGIASAALWHAHAALLVGAHGTAEQRSALTRLATDPGARSAVALYEGFGRGPAELATSVAVEGDQVRVRGRKVGVPFAASADPLVVVGTDPATGAVRAVVLPHGTAGVTVVANPGSLALDATQLGAVDLDVTVPVSALLGGPDADPAGLLATVQRLRLLTASTAVGTALRAVEYAGQYATGRIAFGRPIASYQGVSFPLAEAMMRIEAARAELVDVTNAVVADPGGDHGTAVGQAVSYALAVAVQATRDGVQTLGGHGFIKDHPVELWYRSAATLSALDFDPLRDPFQARL